MDIAPFRISDEGKVATTGLSVFLEKNCVQFLVERLKPGSIITPLDLDETPQKISPKDGYDEVVDGDLAAVESGGAEGLERLAGALVVTGPKTARILCLEVYGRDAIRDPHAESLSALPSSVPTRSPSTQYTGHLKIVTLLDNFHNKRLVIGARDYNYLVTALEYDGSAEVGPSRCGEFPINNSTKIFVATNRDSSSLTGSVLGLAQGNLGVVLHLNDVDDPDPNDQRLGAKTCRGLRELFAGKDTLDISSSKDAEKLLSDLAESFSSMISNKNRTVAARITSE
ncbi:hypothetical protein BGZ83_001032 [Gryganskiella cystojenkinii]|nr:hypothetical protein BGZ83_001032 [Gryganskiella cystojenkinii]